MRFRRTRFPMLLLGAVFGASATACAGGDGAGPAVLPLAGLVDGEIVVMPTGDGTGATLTVRTTVDMACAVVYGTSEDMGRIATDETMVAGAHADHRVVLSRLEPDTEYVYRLQGSGEDGNLYRSELFTFRTPAAEPSAAPDENVGAGATVVEASSEFSADFAAGNAVDGDPSTEWSSAGDGDDASITIDLGAPVAVSALAFRSRAMGDGTAVVETFTVTVDGGDVLGPFEADIVLADVRFTGQVLRFDAERTTGGNTGAVEIEVYA